MREERRAGNDPGSIASVCHIRRMNGTAAGIESGADVTAAVSPYQRHLACVSVLGRYSQCIPVLTTNEPHL